MAGRIRWWLAGAAVALASGAVLWAQRPTPVRTFTLAERPVQTSVVATGRVAPARETTLASTLTGRVVATPVAEGTAVRAATVLVALEADEWQAALAQAEAQRQDARGQWAEAERQWQRQRELHAQGFLSAAALDAADRARDAARRRFDQAEAAVQQARARRAQATVRAPADGVLLARLVEVGDGVTPGKALLRFAVEGTPRILLDLDERDLGALAVGQPAAVRADAWPDQRIAARVQRLAAQVDGARGTVEVELTPTEDASRLLPGMTVSAEIITGAPKPRLLLPLTALRDGRFQTALILGGVTVGVAVVVYITAIINGLQANIIDRTLSAQAHVVLRPAERVNQRAWGARDSADGVVTLADVRKRTQREATVADAPAVLATVRAVPGVAAAAALAVGPGVAQQGGVRKAVSLLGVELAGYQQVIRLDDKLRAGVLALQAGEALIGTELAADLGLTPGSRLRLQSAAGESLSVRVAGVLDYGIQDLNRRRVLLPLRDAQSLLGYGLDVTEIDVRAERLFDAEALAADLRRATGLMADSWQAANGQLVTALRSQSASSLMIRAFVTVAVALGIASVLVVSVVQRQREIGILRAMGTPRHRILGVFLLQGGIVGLGGSLLGAGLGGALAVGFTRIARNADGSPLFPIVLGAELFVSTAVLATAVGVLAAWLPALRASRLDPLKAIRG